MFVKTYKPWWIYFVVIALVTGAIQLKLNPNRLVKGVTKNAKGNTPTLPSVFNVNDLNSTTLNTLTKNYRIRQFRGDEKRHAYHRVGFSFNDVKLEEILSAGKSLNKTLDLPFTSSPVAGLNHIVLSGNKGTVQVVNKSDYSLHWSLDLKKPIISTPVAFLDYAVIADTTGRVYFLNLKDKKIIFTTKLGKSIKASPLVYNESLFVNVESRKDKNFLVKFDLFKGKIAWSSEYIKTKSISSPVLGNGSVFIGDESGNFYSFSAETGKIQWVQGYDNSVQTAPVIYKDQVIFVTEGGSIVSLDQTSGEKKWSYLINENGVGGLAVHNKSGTAVLKSEDAMYKFNLNTGERIARLKLSIKTKSNPIIVENNEDLYIFTICKDNELCMFKYKGLQLLKFFKLNSGLSNQIGVDTNKLLILTAENSSFFVLK